jgi:hypothetical protein
MGAGRKGTGTVAAKDRAGAGDYLDWPRAHAALDDGGDEEREGEEGRFSDFVGAPPELMEHHAGRRDAPTVLRMSGEGWLCPGGQRAGII